MKQEMLFKVVLHLVTLGMLTAGTALAQDASFRRVQLANGISVEIPSHWSVLSQENSQNVNAAGNAIAKNAGLDQPGRSKKTLLAVNAVPAPTGAMIRVSVVSPPDISQADVAAATPSELRDAGIEMKSMFKKLEASGGPRIIEMLPIRIEKFNNHRMLVIPYVRAGIVGPTPWRVDQYKIPMVKRQIEITLSYRQTEAVVWRPILERVMRSLQF